LSNLQKSANLAKSGQKPVKIQKSTLKSVKVISTLKIYSLERAAKGTFIELLTAIEER
jgi:hypothetical protein